MGIEPGTGLRSRSWSEPAVSQGGQGPVLVLLHMLRTQLDLFHKVIPELARGFTVYAVDLPGHGYSDAPDGPYDADFFVRFVEGSSKSLT